MPKLTIDGRTVEVAAGTNVIEAARAAGIEIPYFCYHPYLTVVGQCRICMVEIEGQPRLVVACATPATEGLVVKAETSARAREAREALRYDKLTPHLDKKLAPPLRARLEARLLEKRDRLDHLAHHDRLDPPLPEDGGHLLHRPLHLPHPVELPVGEVGPPDAVELGVSGRLRPANQPPRLQPVHQPGHVRGRGDGSRHQRAALEPLRLRREVRGPDRLDVEDASYDAVVRLIAGTRFGEDWRPVLRGAP